MGLQANMGGEGSLSDGDFYVVAKLLNTLAGIELKPEKRAMITSRISKRVRALGLQSVSEYCNYVASAQGEGEHASFVSALTTNMTRFNRESHHFEHMREQVLPKLRQKAESGGRVRIWSAGCSSGEEPFDLAFNSLSMCPRSPNLDFKILATDIDQKILSIAKKGVYGSKAITCLPQEFQSAYFERVGLADGEVSVAPTPRQLITFGQLNLDGPWPIKGPFDVIMCRNVAIYFDDATQQRLWQRFADALVPGGTLYIGHSENVSAELLGRLKPVAPSIYQRQDNSDAMGSATRSEGKT